MVVLSGRHRLLVDSHRVRRAGPLLTQQCSLNSVQWWSKAGKRNVSQFAYCFFLIAFFQSVALSAGNLKL